MPSTAPASDPRRAPQPPDPAQVPALRIDLPRLLLAGTACWLLATVLSLVVPPLHSDDRDWWPIACAAGAGVGLLGYAVARASSRRRRA